VAAYMKQVHEMEIHAISFDYGQRHSVELINACRAAQALGCVEHKIISLPKGSEWGPSPLTVKDMSVPHPINPDNLGNEVAATYVPGRNLIFLSFAFACALTRGISNIALGVNQIDYSGYPDCREDFLNDFEDMAHDLAACTQPAGMGIHAPVLHKTKVEIVQMAQELKAPLQYTWSCYDPQRTDVRGFQAHEEHHIIHPDGGIYAACGKCDSCVIRKKAFKEAGVTDPCPYVG
ncbi:MAG: 7-cyano-7-deazaguanine synthase, partial [Dehalococcoidia bacterium]|nr:7-cyano-7-deazaguanine synthase [Dehalococcoidia bacterium]